MRLHGRRRLTPILVAAIAVIALAACSSGGATKNAGAAVGAPVSGGTMTLGIQDPPADLDPQTIGSFSEDFIKNNISDKLIYQNPKTMALEPWLATSWTKNDAFTEFVLQLRSDVTFSDGSALTPDVVKANIDLLAFGADALGVPPQKGLLNGYVSTEVTGEHAITVKFSTTNTGFLPALSGRPFGIVGAAMLKLSRQERAKPQNVVASGPFTIAEHVYQQSTTLKKRAGYAWAPESRAHKGEAYLDAVKIVVVPESGVRMGALQSGETDAITDVSPTDEKVLAAGGSTILSRPIPGRAFSLDFNLHKAPSNDLAVRQAIQYGWDRDGLRKAVLTDSYKIANSIVPEVFPGHVDLSDQLKFDPAKSKQILDAAGWVPGLDGIRAKGGQKLSLEVQGNQSLVIFKPALEFVQANLRDIGIELKIKMVSAADWLAGDADPDPWWNINAYAGTGNDPSWLRSLYSPLAPANRLKITQDTPIRQQVSDLMDTLIAPLGDADRMAAVKKVQEEVISTYTLSVPIFTTAQVAAASPKAQGLAYDSLSRLSLYDAWLAA